MKPRTPLAVVLGILVAVPVPLVAAGNEAKGTMAYKTRTIAFRHAYVVKGPDAVSKEPIRRLILSTVDLSKSIARCKSMTCTDADLGEGLSVNLEPGPRFSYWMVMNDQRVQYSGTEPVKALTTTADDGKRLAGKLAFDRTASGGPKVDVDFDAALVKEVSAP